MHTLKAEIVLLFNQDLVDFRINALTRIIMLGPVS
uniref:Uncharacterized protein n=1 Tax=Arundo donax TaxID=35708 RepID=A0A0A8ZX68_ARUDO